MLAVVKEPHIELVISGKNTAEFINWINKKYDIRIIETENDEEIIPVRGSDFWNEMQSNRIGNMLAAARYKAGLTQKQLAKKALIKQNMISDYELGKRKLTISMAKKFADILNVSENRFYSNQS